MTLLPLYRVAAGNSPLIRPAATFPRRGKALPKRLLPEGLRPQARVGAQPPKAALSAETEAAARRRLMRGGLTLLPFYRVAAGNSPLIRPAATFPRRGKALHKRLLHPGRSCRPQAADEGRPDSISLLPSCRRKLAPHPACGHLPPEGEGSPQKASPEGLRPQARVGAQPPKAALSAETEAAARRRLMRGNLDSIIPFTELPPETPPHPACGHLPPEGKGSPLKGFSPREKLPPAGG